MTKVEEMIENLNTKNLSLHGNLVAEKAAHACALINSTRLQRDRKNVVEEKKEVGRLRAVKKTKQKNSPMIERLKKDFLTVAIRAAGETGAQKTPVEQDRKGVGELKKKRKAPP